MSDPRMLGQHQDQRDQAYFKCRGREQVRHSRDCVTQQSTPLVAATKAGGSATSLEHTVPSAELLMAPHLNTTHESGTLLLGEPNNASLADRNRIAATHALAADRAGRCRVFVGGSTRLMTSR